MWVLVVVFAAGGLYALDRYVTRKRLTERHWRELRLRPGPSREEFVKDLRPLGISEIVGGPVYDYYAK